MSLSPEERARIYEEEKARLEAQESLKREEQQHQAEINEAKPKAEDNTGLGGIRCNPDKCCGVVLAILMVIGLFYLAWQTPTTRSVQIGSTVTIDLKGTDALMAKTQEACGLRDKACNALDMVGLASLIALGLVREISPGTKAQVIGVWGFEYEVRILDGPYAGESGYVPTVSASLCSD